MKKKIFQKVNGEFRFSADPNEKCMTVLAELKSPNNVTERNTNICVATANVQNAHAGRHQYISAKETPRLRTELWCKR